MFKQAKLIVAPVALLLSLCGTLTVTAPALATPVEGPAGEAFYTPPAPQPAGPPGTLTWYRPATVNLGVPLPAVKAWTVLYSSRDQQGEPDWVTGTVIVPTSAWPGQGSRPVVDYAVGTQGLGHTCAPSLQMAAGTEYDGAAAVAALRAGYGVVMTDYQGYTNGAIPTYTAGKAEGQATLDIARAADQIPGSGISPSNPTIVWGYSQGGQAAGWAGELDPTYAPELNLIGVAAGGVPANLNAVAEFADGSVGTGFVLSSVIGLEAAYPQIAALEDQLINQAGKEAKAKLLSECVIKALADFRDRKISEFTVGNRSLTQLKSEYPELQQIINEQQLGTQEVPAPVYHYHGLEDEYVPITQDVTLHHAWCGLGVVDDFQLYHSEHMLTDPTAVATVMKWIGERVAGSPAPSTCGLHAEGQTLPATARLTPEVGDLTLRLPAWAVSGSVTTAKLGLGLNIPAGSTFSADADLTAETLSATLFTPPINETVTLFGLVPVTIRANLVQAGPINGHASLSEGGTVTMAATGGANLTVKSFGIAFFNISLGCTTVRPIELPLNVSEPVNALASGSISISASVTVPPFGGCNPLSAALVTSLISGSGNKLNITVTPPPPIAW